METNKKEKKYTEDILQEFNLSEKGEKQLEEYRKLIRQALLDELLSEVTKLPDTYEDDESAVFRTTKKEVLAIINHKRMK